MDQKGPVQHLLPAKKLLKVLVVGAGITGLTTALALSLCGHKVTIYEQAQALSEIGAGLQIAPNASRILELLGLLEKVKEKGNVLEKIVQRRWKDGSEIGTVPLMPLVSTLYTVTVVDG